MSDGRNWRSSAPTDRDRVSEAIRQTAQAMAGQMAGSGSASNLTAIVSVSTIRSDDGVRKLLSADQRRRSALLVCRDDSPDPVYVGTNGGVSESTGLRVRPGGFFRFRGTNDWWIMTPGESTYEIATDGV